MDITDNAEERLNPYTLNFNDCSAVAFNNNNIIV